MLGEILLGAEVTLAPFASWCIWAADQEGSSDRDDADERYDESDTPRDMGREMLIRHQRIENGGHQKVGHSSSSIPETSSEGVGGTDNVLVEEASGPYLARHKRATQNTNKET